VLGNLTEDRYYSLWETNIILPNSTTSSNCVDLQGKHWEADFGNQSAKIRAEIISATLTNIVLQEFMEVTENHISKNESELWQDLFAYKIFKIKYDPPYGGVVFGGECGSIIDDFSWEAHFTILKIENKRFTVEFGNSFVNVIMNGSFSIELSAHVGLRTKWSKLKKFYGYVELSGSLAANFTLTVSEYEGSWDMDIFEWSGNKSKPITFWIGPVPVWLIPHFAATAKFAIKITGEFEVHCGAEVNGGVKAGVGWKKKFYPILDAEMSASATNPSCYPDPDHASYTIEARPSLGFKPSIMFYDASGPYVEIEPYIKVIYWYNGTGYTWQYIAGVCINVGISFSGWFKKITGLHDWHLSTLFDWELWRHPDQPAHDIAVTNIRSEEYAFIGENVGVSVDVANLGYEDEDNVTVTLYYCYWTGISWSSWQPIGTKTGVNIPARSFKTVNFTLPTTDLDGLYVDGLQYAINATATISHNETLSNNNETRSLWLEIQDIAIVNLEANESNQTIEVTLYNNGTGNLSSVVVQLYYDSSLVGDWFDSTRMSFDLQAHHSTKLLFSWDVTTYSDDSEFGTVAPLLQYEASFNYPYSRKNNFYGETEGLLIDVVRDNKIDLKDVFAVAVAFGSEPGHSTWNLNCDVYIDGRVDLKDYFPVALNYGKKLG
jgi:archaellum component FlaF (FlaF/FlaG flagellin family)